jgi:glycosyltransferase involved in cell wall biosynthesis
MAKVSILMNAYNAEQYIREAIDSVYSQTYTDWEIILIDNCSTDKTKQIVETYDNRIKYYKTRKNVPLGAARNFGLKYCKGEYLAFLDTDDIWLSSKLDKQVSILNENRNYFMCYTGVIIIDEFGKRFKELIPKNKSGYLFPNLLVKNEVNMQSVLIRNENISIREDMFFSPDYNLWLNVSAKWQISVIKEKLIKYRVHNNSLTKKTISRWGVEKELTINDVLKRNPDLRKKYPKEIKLAYAYAGQLKAKYYMHENRRVDAIKELYKHKFIKISYFALFILGFLPKSIWVFVHQKMESR